MPPKPRKERPAGVTTTVSVALKDYMLGEWFKMVEKEDKEEKALYSCQ